MYVSPRAISSAITSRLLGAFLLLITATAGLLLGPNNNASAADRLTITAKPFKTFNSLAGPNSVHGELRFIGGFSFLSNNEKLGGLSGLRLRDGGNRLLSVTDQGNWFAADILRDDALRPVGLDNGVLKPLRDKNKKPFKSKRHADAEGLEIVGDEALVSFERNSRVLRYKLTNVGLGQKGRAFRQSIRKVKLPNNSGLEAVVSLSDAISVKAKAARVAVFAEHATAKDGSLKSYVSDANGKWRKFTVKPHADFKLTDAASLNEKEILLLERQFSTFSGVAIQIRRLKKSELVAGTLVDGPVIFSADLSSQVDNMEGLAVWKNADGKTIISLISDDNFSRFQRNLYLEFEYLGGAKN